MPSPLRIGFKVSPANVGWQRMHDMWQRAGEVGAFDSAWLFDHFYPVDGDGSCFEATTSLAALIPLVPGLQVGHLVLANPYRHPALTAKIASGDWDGILATHSSFERIGMSRDYQEQFLLEQIRDYDRLLSEHAGHRGQHVPHRLELGRRARDHHDAGASCDLRGIKGGGAQPV